MKYLFLIYENEATWINATDAYRNDVIGQHMAFAEKAGAAGALVGGYELQPTTTATCVRVRGETVISDGPFAETKEQLGGYYLLECRDLDDALNWAAQIPTAQTGTVEVRPVVEDYPT